MHMPRDYFVTRYDAETLVSLPLQHINKSFTFDEPIVTKLVVKTNRVTVKSFRISSFKKS
jgi:hypothetical protein